MGLRVGLLVSLAWGCGGVGRVAIPLDPSARLGPPEIRGGSEAVTGFTLTLAAPEGVVRGGQPLRLAVALDSASPLSVVQLQLALDGENIDSFVSIEPTTTEAEIAIPALDATGARLRLAAVDERGQLGFALSEPFAIDATAPVLSLQSPEGVVAAGASVTWTASDAHFGAAPIALSISDSSGAQFGAAIALANVGSYVLPLDLPSGETYRVRVIATDEVGQSSERSSTSDFAIDATAPGAPPLERLSPALVGEHAVDYAVTDCTDRVLIQVSESPDAPTAEDPGWMSCDLLPHTLALAPVDAEHTLYAWALDAVGNVSPTASTFVVESDTTAPALTVLTPQPGAAIDGNVAYAISWTASDAHFGAEAILLEWSEDGASFTAIAPEQPNTGMYAWSPAVAATAGGRLRVTAVDAVGHASSVVTMPILIAYDEPALGRLLLNGEGLPCSAIGDTQNPFALVSLEANDPVAAITHVCFKTRSLATPTPDDLCFVAVDGPIYGGTAGLDVTLTDVPVPLGFLKGNVTVRAWVKNAAGLVSPTAATECVGQRTIDYDPGTPPDVNNVYATAGNNPCASPTQLDTTRTAGGDVVIKWNATFTNAASATPIALEYTTNDIDWLPIASAITNGSSAGCSLVPPGPLDDPSCTEGLESSAKTGCYVWSAPPLAEAKVRVLAIDAKGLVTARSSVPPLNAWPIRFLAGNPDPGIGGHASSTVFLLDNVQSTNDFDFQALAVSSRGVFFFRDPFNGIFWVNPANGRVQSVIDHIGDATPDDGPLSTATARNPGHITVDYDDNLIIWDHNRIRRVNIGPLPTCLENKSCVVETLIGGGTTPLGDDTPALEMQVNPCITSLSGDCALTLAPNGDMYFSNTDGRAPIETPPFTLQHYSASSGRVNTIRFSGTGYARAVNGTGGEAQDMTLCKQSFPLPFLSLGSSEVRRIFTQVRGFSGWPHCSYGFGSYDAGGVATTPRTWLSGAQGRAAIYTMGLDGRFYHYDENTAGSLFLYDLDAELDGDPITLPWTRIAGGPVTSSDCSDDERDAVGCPLRVRAMFVDAQSHVYWTDSGEIFALNDNGKVVKVMGQSYNYGEGGSALSVRIPSLTHLDHWRTGGGSDRVVFADAVNVRIKEATVGGNVRTLAGTGVSATTPTLGADASTQPLLMAAGYTLAVDRSNGSVYSLRNGGGASSRLVRLVRGSPDYWEAFSGHQSVSADPMYFYGNQPSGTFADQVSYRELYDPTVHAVSNGKVLYHLTSLNSDTDYYDSLYLTFDTAFAPASTVMTRLAGINGLQPTAQTPISPPTPRLSFNFTASSVWNRMPAVRDVDGGGNVSWYAVASNGSTQILRIPESATPSSDFVSLATQLPNGFRSFTFRRSGTSRIIYYCHDVTGTLRARNIDTAAEVDLTWPFPTFSTNGLPTLQCEDRGLFYWPERNTLLFAYREFGLFGVAEYVAPPVP